MPPTEPLSVLEQRLRDWVDGKITVPDSRKFHLPDGETARLNVIDSKPQPTDWYARFQGYFLGARVMDDHLVAYMGLQDGQGHNYFVPLNIGELNKGYVGAIFNDPNRSVFPSGQADVKIIPLEQMQRLMASNFRNDTVVFTTTTFTTNEQPDPRVNFPELQAQVEVARQYSLWSVAAATGNYQDAVLTKKYPLVTALIDHEITSVDPASMPNVSVFWVPRNDVPDPLPTLPFTVSGSGYDVSDPFTLAKGMYRVTYAATGTCTGFTGRLEGLGNDLSVPVAAGAPATDGTEPPTTSVRVVTAGRYYIAAGVPGCAWSFTFANP
jgi:hypothetical protein